MKNCKEITAELYDTFTSLLYELNYKTVEELHAGEKLSTLDKQIRYWTDGLDCYPLSDDDVTSLTICLSNIFGCDDRFDALNIEILTAIANKCKQ